MSESAELALSWRGGGGLWVWGGRCGERRGVWNRVGLPGGWLATPPASTYRLFPLSPTGRKRKLEELVTKHLGKTRDVSDEDIKSSVLHGAVSGGVPRGAVGRCGARGCLWQRVQWEEGRGLRCVRAPATCPLPAASGCLAEIADVAAAAAASNLAQAGAT